MTAICENCRFWLHEPAIKQAKAGPCRRRPPNWMAGGRDCAFPLSQGEHWCGEHEPTGPDTTPAIAALAQISAILAEHEAGKDSLCAAYSLIREVVDNAVSGIAKTK